MDLRDLWTERLLIDAGIAAGMRVIDLGCGRGDVSLMLARLVGDSGRVLGIDRDPKALAVARQRANELGVAHLEFVEADLCTVLADRDPFDAVVGRRVLMYQPDPGAMLRHFVEILRPGGVIVFQEHDATIPATSRAPLPLHVQVSQWIWRTVEREGANLHMGFDLPQLLEAAGLRVEHARAEAVVQTATIGYPTAMIVRAMLPRIVQHGVASEAEIDIETLAARLDVERQTAQTTYVSELVFGVSARKPV